MLTDTFLPFLLMSVLIERMRLNMAWLALTAASVGGGALLSPRLQVSPRGLLWLVWYRHSVWRNWQRAFPLSLPCCATSARPICCFLRGRRGGGA